MNGPINRLPRRRPRRIVIAGPHGAATLARDDLPKIERSAAPTHRHVEVPRVAIVRFRDGKLAHEHIYGDQACVLKHVGLLNAPSLPIAGAEAAHKILALKFRTKT